MVIVRQQDSRLPGCDPDLTVICAPLCSANSCLDRVTWTTWDGSQILAEERRPYPDNSSFLPQFGSVSYVHSLDLDHPLAVLTTKVRVLNPNWRGPFESSLTPAGAAADRSLVPANVTRIAWPAGQGVYVRPLVVEASTDPSTWLGSLLTDQQDGTGHLFRRSRYYAIRTQDGLRGKTPLGSRAGSTCMGLRVEIPFGRVIGDCDRDGIAPHSCAGWKMS